ncbi:MAG TPA: serine/threonine-protein kinase [Streptosporangiaceae bacterium]|nr:serine/threonine-protein kinase [Streptosporangiaceae bacterium]
MIADANAWAFEPGAEMAPGLRAWTCLGAGDRHESWLAWSQRHWSPVVVKLPVPDRARDRRTIEGLARQARLAGSLAHPGVQRLLGTGNDGNGTGTRYLIFEYAEGPTLSASLDDEGPLDPGDVVRLGLQLAGVLHYLHGTEIVHLDLKPSNICLVDGRPVLLDFDAACRAGRRRPAGAPIGSPPYMAPEQFHDDEVTPRSDLFALGAVLYEAVRGQCPYNPEETPDGWTVPQERGAPPLPEDAVPAGLAEVIRALLDPLPERRPGDARSVLTALARSLPPGEEGMWPSWVR